MEKGFWAEEIKEAGMGDNRTDFYDVLGVGVGPSNLSLAALLAPCEEIRALFFERRPEFRWHPGLLLQEAEIQVSYIKDLVTPVDPTSRYSFLAFLSRHRRLYRFVHADFPKVKRLEFDQYFRWVSKQLDNVAFGAQVDAVELEGDTLVVNAGGEKRSTRNLVLGAGLSPQVPDFTEPHIGDTVFHSGEFLHRCKNPKGLRVVVIGGGQSSAEIVAHLLDDVDQMPRSIHWISRRSNFLPLDETPFVNELFTPRYSNYFFSLPRDEQNQLVEDQRLASDGISPSLLERLYRRAYEVEFLDDVSCDYQFWPGRELCSLSPASGRGWRLEVVDLSGNRSGVVEADVVVLSTGYRFKLPECLTPIAGRIPLEDEHYLFKEDFSIVWDGPSSCNIFAQNAARPRRGVADPNLSLMAWRSAVIVNSLLGRRIYDMEDGPSSLCFGEGWPPVPRPALEAVSSGLAPSAHETVKADG